MRRLWTWLSAGLVAAFAVLVVLGLAGFDLRPGGDPTAHDTDLSSGEVSASATAGASPASPAPSVSPSVSPSASIRPPRQQIHHAGPPLQLIPQPVTFSFRMATFNVLGSQHKANGAGRARTAAGMIADRGIDLAGLQEVQRDQRAAIAAALPGYAIWPGDLLGNQGYRHQILYRTDRFELVDGASVPYVFDSQTVPLPYALMRDKQTGGEFYLIDAHNSARGLQAQRDSATAIEASLINRLKATGLPVLITIDSNEHTEWFCRIAGETGLTSANGGYWSDGCRLPAGPLRIDWIMGGGTGDSGVAFSDYVQDITPERIGISDHYLVYADAEVTSPPPGADPSASPSADPSASPSASPSAG